MIKSILFRLGRIKRSLLNIVTMSSLKKINSDAEIKALRSRRKKFKRLNDASELSDIYCQLGQCMRDLYRQANIRNEEFEQKIMRKFRKAIEMSKLSTNNENCSLAYRALAEMALEGDDLREAIYNIDRSMLYAKKAEKPSFIQLCYHQCAFIYSNVPDSLYTASKLAEEGLVYLREHAAEIDGDKYEVQTGGDSARRKAGLENLLAGIYVDAENFPRAQEHNERCLEYAAEHNDIPLHCRALNLKLRMTSGRERLDIARLLSDRAQKTPDKNAQIKFDADYSLAVESLRFNEIFDAKCLLWRLHEKHLNRLDKDDCQNVKKYLVFIYKTERRLQRISDDLSLDNVKSLAQKNDRLEVRARIFEKIADEAIDYSLIELAFHFYERMLQSSANMYQKNRALVSLAETARDLNDYILSARYFRELLEMEKKIELCSVKIVKTEICIAVVSSQISNIPPIKRHKLLEETYKKCMANVDKQNVLVAWVEFLENNPTLCDEEELAQKRETLRSLQNLDNDNECSLEQLPDEDLLASNYSDQLDHMSEFEIFRNIKDEMKLIEEELQLKKKVNAVVNNQGETRMHVVARSGDTVLLRKLIDFGYNINAKDNSGWTPLSEAVSANQVSSVRLLLQNGADVNCRSIHGLTSDDGEETASGHTPLMEACSSGNVEMAKILLTMKASIVQADDDGWTCVDFLREFYNRKSEDLDEKEKDKVKNFIKFLQSKQKKAGYIPRVSLPPSRRRNNILIRNRSNDCDFGDGAISLEAEARLKRRSGSSILGEEENGDGLTKSKGNESDGSTDDLLMSLCNSITPNSKSSKNKVAPPTEEQQNLLEYRRIINAMGRKPGNSTDRIVPRRKAFPSSLADAADEHSLKANNELDKTCGVLPADYEFLAPEDDDENDDHSQGSSFSQRSRSSSRKIRELDDEQFFEEENEDEVLDQIRARQSKRRRLM